MNPLTSPSSSRFVRAGVFTCLILAWVLNVSAAWSNGGFETGTANQAPAAPWSVTLYSNGMGLTIQSPQTFAGLNLQTGTNHATTELHTTGPFAQPDATLGAAATFRWPRYGSNCAVVNQLGRNQSANSLSQTATLSAADVDPLDGQIHMRFTIAPVMEDAGHTAPQEPYYYLQVSNVTRGTILYRDFGALSDASIPWKTFTGGTTTDRYTDWQLVDVRPGSGAGIGDQVQLQLIASGCQPGAHFGELYVDGLSTVVPGISLDGTAVFAVIAGSNLTYTLTYRNGTTSNETGIQMSFTTPPNTTFQSASAPVGVTLVPPTVGTAGTVTATLSSPLAGGANGSFTVTVNVNPGTTSSITARNYGIQSTQEPELLGALVTTDIAQLSPIVLRPPVLEASDIFSCQFTNGPGFHFTAFTATNLLTPTNQWTPSGSIVESPAGTYTLTDSITDGSRFYRVVSQ